jgi:SSS family solute:Na+ symporter
MQKTRETAIRFEKKNIDYSTSAGFNIAAVIVTVILIALYALWW